MNGRNFCAWYKVHKVWEKRLINTLIKTKFFHSKESMRIKGQTRKDVGHTYSVVVLVLLYQYLQIKKN